MIFLKKKKDLLEKYIRNEMILSIN